MTAILLLHKNIYGSKNYVRHKYKNVNSVLDLQVNYIHAYDMKKNGYDYCYLRGILYGKSMHCPSDMKRATNEVVTAALESSIH